MEANNAFAKIVELMAIKKALSNDSAFLRK